MPPKDEMPPVAMRALTEADLQAAHALTNSFGWPHRLEDWAFMHALGQGVAMEQAGNLVATGLLWPFGEDRAALGLVGVSAGLQGQGIGRAVMQRLLDLAGDRAVGLYATEAGETLYRQLGFATCGTVRQLQGATFRSPLQPLPEGGRLRPVGRSDPAAVAALDRAATGLDRTALMEALLRAGTAVMLDRGDSPAGFAILRRFGRGQVIGPVVASDATGAKALISHFLNLNPGRFVRLDVTEESGLAPWLAGFGLGDAGRALHMVRGPAPAPAGPARRFVLASQAFG